MLTKTINISNYISRHWWKNDMVLIFSQINFKNLLEEVDIISYEDKYLRI